jgi:hypothetical protein
MITTEQRIGSCGAGRWFARCLLVSSIMLGATAAAAEGAPQTSTDAILPEEVMTRPGPFDWAIKRFYYDSPGCVSAKLDIWFWGGRYTHQLFTARSGVEHGFGYRPALRETSPSSQQALEGEKANPATRQILDADSTTVLVGREGCRYRIRIERAE